MNQSGQSIIGSGEMVKKIYFPRLIIPLSKAVVGLVDFAINFLLLIGMMVYFTMFPSPHLVFLPITIILLVAASLGIGIWLSALTIRYRDFQHVIPFTVQLGLYATPVAYPSSLIPEKYQLLYYLNPMAGITDLFRWCIVGTDVKLQFVMISLVVGGLLFVTSVYYFKRVERIMADII